MSADVGDTFKPGDTVKQSGIYDVLHDTNHRQKHQVTCVYGEPFPPCRGCGHGVKFRLAVKAIHVKQDNDFK
jgi:hypothetical protein